MLKASYNVRYVLIPFKNIDMYFSEASLKDASNGVHHKCFANNFRSFKQRPVYNFLINNIYGNHARIQRVLSEGFQL